MYCRIYLFCFGVAAANHLNAQLAWTRKSFDVISVLSQSTVCIPSAPSSESLPSVHFVCTTAIHLIDCARGCGLFDCGPQKPQTKHYVAVIAKQLGLGIKLAIFKPLICNSFGRSRTCKLHAINTQLVMDDIRGDLFKWMRFVTTLHIVYYFHLSVRNLMGLRQRTMDDGPDSAKISVSF